MYKTSIVWPPQRRLEKRQDKKKKRKSHQGLETKEENGQYTAGEIASVKKGIIQRQKLDILEKKKQKESQKKIHIGLSCL